MQGVQNLLRLLPDIAFRIIELLGPFLRIFESMMEGAIGWAVHLMARPRVLDGRFGPRLGRRVPNRSAAPDHRNNGYRREYFGFQFVARPGSEDGVPLLGRYSSAARSSAAAKQFPEAAEALYAVARTR